MWRHFSRVSSPARAPVSSARAQKGRSAGGFVGTASSSALSSFADGNPRIVIGAAADVWEIVLMDRPFAEGTVALRLWDGQEERVFEHRPKDLTRLKVEYHTWRLAQDACETPPN